MRLTHIKLAGFKSFVDPTTIHVPGQLVAVIGPNGCGKSNVIDAVRWVLGEASAKHLRGESMQDVIFNGANTRKAVSRAAVELVFNNSDHSLAGAWGQYSEIAIKRTLTRQGESAYYINNQAVRRRDITDLFLGTGVGARGYAVIEQGMIARIIEARPEELRAYLEEAAGVSKYKERRRETESRLKDTREHLTRLADLQSELSRQVEKLEKQAQTAARYQDLNQQLKQQQDLLDYGRWQAAQQEGRSAHSDYQARLAEQEALSHEQAELNERSYQLQLREHEQQEQAHQIHNQRALLRERLARLEEQIRHRQNLQQRLEREQLQAQAHHQQLAQQQAILAEQLAESELHLQEQQLALEEWQLQLEDSQHALPTLEAAQDELTQAQQHQQQQHSRLQREADLAQQKLAHAQQAQQRIQARLQALAQETEQLNLPGAEELAQAQEAVAVLQAQNETLEHAVHAGQVQWTALQAATEAAQQAYQQQQTACLNTQAQHDALKALLSEATATDANGQDFWSHTDHAAAPSLWQHIQVHPEWQHALSVFLGQRLHTRATGHFTLPQPLPAAAANWLTDPHNSTDPINDRLPENALLRHIHSSKPFQAALQHWLDGVLCAPDLASALAQQNHLQAQQCWLTPEGHLVDRHSVQLFAATHSDNLLARQARLAEWAQDLARQTPLLQQAEQQWAERKQQLQQLQAQQNHWQQQGKALAEELKQAHSHATALWARTNQSQLRQEHIRQEQAQLQAEQTQAQADQHHWQLQSQQLRQAEHDLAQEQQQLALRHNAQQHSLKQARLQALEANRQHGLAQLAVQKLQQQQQHWQQQQQQLQQQQQALQQRQSELVLADADEQQADEQQASLTALNEALYQQDEAYADSQGCLKQTQTALQQLHQQQQAVATALPALQAATQAALLQQQQAILNAEHFAAALHARGADVNALAQAHTGDPDLNSLSDNISRLARTLNSLGAVNLAALSELEEARQRSQYYQEQSEDVVRAIELLQQAMAQIDAESQALFQQTFDAVNAQVQKLFPILFGGGEAYLTKVGEDWLSAGVSIMARPPGKKNSTIHLLSGGEKALTAMSLVFALFSLNPAPFCLLDEVDAPLDDANTARFCQLVQEMSQNTQFLYISHNRLTMEMAEQLIGVTMQEKGVSRIVDVDIKQALDLAQATAD